MGKNIQNAQAFVYASTTKRGGHIDLPLSVCTSIRMGAQEGSYVVRGVA
jgi:hypothetical protein